MADETELARKRTAWVRGTTNTKMGTAVVTSERVVFFDEKFSANAAFGLVAGAVTDALQQGHEATGPLLEIPLAAVTGAAREKKLLNKDRLRVATAEAEYLFNDGWSSLGPALRRALAERGRTVTDAGGDAWRVG